MVRHYSLVFSLTVLCGLPISASASLHAMAVPPDSFINQHVDSVAQLRQQVTLDPVVRRRLARHFHLSGPAMVRYIQDNLVLKKTTRTQRYHVYCISRTGREYVINARLPIGTPVFVMRSTGKPILKLACGNPMVATLPTVESRKPLAPPKMASMPMQTPAKLAPGLLPNGPVITSANFGPGVYITAPTVTKISPYISGILPKGGGSSLGYLAGIPLLYGIINHGGGTNTGGTSTGGTNTGGTNTGGTSTGGTSTGGTNNTGGSNTGGSSTGGTNTGETNTGGTSTGGNNTGPSPVPEPGASLAFAIGGAGLALLAGARRRWRK